MMYGAPRPPVELPPTSGLRDHIASFQPHPGGLPLGGPPQRGPGQMQPMQQGNQQAMLGAMQGYLR